jgi:hypothetical protein
MERMRTMETQTKHQVKKETEQHGDNKGQMNIKTNTTGLLGAMARR